MVFQDPKTDFIDIHPCRSIFPCVDVCNSLVGCHELTVSNRPSMFILSRLGLSTLDGSDSSTVDGQLWTVKSLQLIMDHQNPEYQQWTVNRVDYDIQTTNSLVLTDNTMKKTQNPQLMNILFYSIPAYVQISSVILVNIQNFEKLICISFITLDVLSNIIQPLTVQIYQNSVCHS